MSWSPFYNIPSVQELTVRHAYLLMKIEGPKAAVMRKQAWLKDPADLLALEELKALYMADIRNGVWIRTYQGQAYMDKLYEKQVPR